MKKIISVILIIVLVLAFCPAYSQVTNNASFSILAQASKEGLNVSKAILIKGEKLKLKVYDNSEKRVWKSSDENVATVSSKGIVKATGKGTAVITVKTDTKKYKCKVIVETPKINKKSLLLISSDTYSLKILGTTQKVKWSSSDNSIATVSSDGSVTAKEKGVATVIGKISTKKYTCKITVEKPYLNETSIEINKGDSAELELLGTSRSATWKSEDNSIATVSSGGKVTGINKGTVHVVATVGGKEYKCAVIVNVPAGSLTGNITYKYNNYRGNVADTNAKVILIPTDGSAKEMTVDHYVEWTVVYSDIQNDRMTRDYNIYKAKVDGTGQYYFDYVPIGEYRLIVISGQTTDGRWFEDKEAYASMIAVLFYDCLNKEAADSLGQAVAFNKYSTSKITIRENTTSHYSHDFGITYI